MARVRSQLLMPVGEELTRAGRLDQCEDLFFLDLREARRLVTGSVDLRPLIHARQASYAAELRRRHVPRVLLSDGTEPIPADSPAVKGMLRGAPASSGVVTGTRASCSTRWARGWNRARSWWRPRPILGGRRCS
jgi:rifampicin phosphotransferase